MINFDMLKDILIVSSINGAICVAFIQKIKKAFLNSTFIPIYSFIINLIFGSLFCISFTKIPYYCYFWIGLFSFIGADSIYKTLEGKLQSFKEITKTDYEEIKYE